MRAVVLAEGGVRVEDRPAPEPGPGWARLAVRLAGVCSTDLQLRRGYMGFRGVLGHEVVGVVDRGPPGWLGRRATAEINFACGACAACARGLGRHCPTRTVLGILGADGCMAEHVAVPLANLHALPDGVPDEAAVFAEPLAAAYEVLEQVHVRPGTPAVVLGDGKLGLLCALALRQAGARVVCVGRHARKRSLLEAVGVATRPADALDPAAAGAGGGAALALAGALGLDLAPGERVPLVVEATGSADGLALAIALVAPRGTLVLKSTVADRHHLSLAPLVIDEVTVVGSRCGPFAPALDALARGAIDPRPLVERVYPLEEGPAALDHAATSGALKVLLRP